MNRQLSKQATGKLGEAAAAAFLVEAGYMLEASNWRCNRGELDLIMWDGSTLVFIEVRTRSAGSGGKYGAAAESVDGRKQRKLRMLAQIYMRMHGYAEPAIRFDVITVLVEDGPNGEPLPQVTHYKGAF